MRSSTSTASCPLTSPRSRRCSRGSATPADWSRTARCGPSVALRLHRQLYSRKANDDASDRLKQLLAQRADAPRGSSSAPENCAPENRNANLALCALGRLSAVKNRAIYVSDVQRVLERILEDRRPDWIDDWIDYELKQSFTSLDFPAIPPRGKSA